MRILDPFIAFVDTGECTSFVVGLAEQFTRPCDESGVALILAGELLDKDTVVKPRILKIKHVAGEPSMVHFATGSFIGSWEFKGPACHVVNPDVVVYLDGAPHLRFETQTLVLSTRLWWSEFGNKHPPISNIRDLNVPYTCVNGLPLFVAESTEKSMPSVRVGAGICGGGSGSGSIAEVTVTCLVCSKEWIPSAMRQHVDFHLLHEPELITATYPCEFCGQESAQYSSDLSQLSGCAVWFHNKQPKMHCKLVGDVKYNFASAAKISKTAPCTNRPMLCPQCPLKPGVVHWKLNMRKHWQNAHSSGNPFPVDFAAQLETVDPESAWALTVGGERKKVQ